jgi:DNA-binding NarL/FixJ family response regulator
VEKNRFMAVFLLSVKSSFRRRQDIRFQVRYKCYILRKVGLCSMNEQVRVLIADDQQPTRQGLMALLSLTSQIEIMAEAINGQEAVLLTEKYHPDVILMDMKMPVMDGLQATRLIKNRWPEIKIIGLTIYPNYRTEAIKAGIDTFLLKGCAADVLQSTILEANSSEAGYAKQR